MSRRYVNAAILYAVLAMAGGVFYREYTRLLSYSGETNLSVLHTHYFLLGMIFFLLLALLDHSFGFSGGQRVGGWIVVYHAGLNITVAGLLLRGLAQVRSVPLSYGLNGALSGVSGLGHLLLSMSMIAILLSVRSKASQA